MLQNFSQIMGAAKSRAWLLNREGYWLKGPFADLEWAFMYRRPEASVAHRHAKAWRGILAADRGQFENDQGLWTFSTVHPLIEGQKTSSGTHEAFEPSRSDLENRDYFWKVVLFFPREEYYATMWPTGLRLSAATALVLVILFFGCWLTARARVREKIAKEEVHRANKGLERTVHERTKELTVERRRMEEIIWGTNVGTWEWNIQTGEIVFNERWAEIVGYTLEELAPVSIDSWLTLVHPDDLEQSNKLLERNFSGESDYYECEVRMRHKNGEWVWGLQRGKVVEWTEDGKPLRMSGTHTDATKRKEFEKTLVQRTHDLGERIKELTGLFALSNILDRSDISFEDTMQMAVEVIPPAWHYPEITCARITFDGREFTGGNFEETVWRQASDIVIHGEREGVVEVFFLEEKPELDEGPFLKEERNLIDDIAARLGQGILRKQAEEELYRLNAELEQRVNHRTAELSAANDELKAFSYSVSHDLRTPLRAMDGFSRMLLEKHGDKLEAEGRRYLERVREGSQRMGLLVDDLLKLSRVARAELQRREVDLSELARTIASELQQTAPERKVAFDIAPGIVANGDGRLLRLLLVNLLDNAWKFTSNHLQTKIDFGVTEHEGKPAFYVRDDGAGFDMAYVEKLFNPFQRLHRKDEFPGTGIGLATVKRIVDRHGGEVWITAGVEKGACVCFTLSTPGEFK